MKPTLFLSLSLSFFFFFDRGMRREDPPSGTEPTPSGAVRYPVAPPALRLSGRSFNFVEGTVAFSSFPCTLRSGK